VILADIDLSSLLCAAAPNTAAGHPFVILQMKSLSYAPAGNLSDGSSETPIGPGTYPVDFEGESDDDLCMAGAGMALLDVRDIAPVDGGGATTVASAVTGTVTLTTIVPGHIAGSFAVQMAAYLPSGLFDTAHPTAFSGTFDATSCPGTML
jgi:hypothetical protein